MIEISAAFFRILFSSVASRAKGGVKSDTLFDRAIYYCFLDKMEMLKKVLDIAIVFSISSSCPGWSSSRQLLLALCFFWFSSSISPTLWKILFISLLMTPPSTVPSVIPHIGKQQLRHSLQIWVNYFLKRVRWRGWNTRDIQRLNCGCTT